MSTLIRVLFTLFCAFEIFGSLLVLPPTSRTLPAARQRRKNLSGYIRNPAMQLGKRPEQRQDPDRMRTAHRHHHGQRTRHTISARHDRQQHRAQPPGHDTGPGSRTAPRPATAPQSQDSGRPDPTPDDSTHAAQDAHRTRHAPPYYYIHPSAATARQDARQRHTLDIWTGNRQQPTQTPPTPTATATVHELNRERTPDSAHAGVLKKCDN